jgi:hypothetical protein
MSKTSEPNSQTSADCKHKLQNKIVENLTMSLIDLMSTELKKEETRDIIKKNILSPIINIIYSEIYCYIYALVFVISAILFTTMLILAALIYIYFKEL